MIVETLLPLGKEEPRLRAPKVPLSICRVVEDAQLVMIPGRIYAHEYS